MKKLLLTLIIFLNTAVNTATYAQCPDGTTATYDFTGRKSCQDICGAASVTQQFSVSNGVGCCCKNLNPNTNSGTTNTNGGSLKLSPPQEI